MRLRRSTPSLPATVLGWRSAGGYCLRAYGGFTIVRTVAAERPRPVEWIGSSRRDLQEFPVTVRGVVGYALYQAQVGLKHRDAKPLRGLGGNILEVSSRHNGGG